MGKRRGNRALPGAHGILTFTAVSQVVLYLWASGRITGAFAGSALIAVLLFGMLERAVREVLGNRQA